MDYIQLSVFCRVSFIWYYASSNIVQFSEGKAKYYEIILSYHEIEAYPLIIILLILLESFIF
jgi:hypothetical protein